MMSILESLYTAQKKKKKALRAVLALPSPWIYEFMNSEIYIYIKYIYMCVYVYAYITNKDENGILNVKF